MKIQLGVRANDCPRALLVRTTTKLSLTLDSLPSPASANQRDALATKHEGQLRSACPWIMESIAHRRADQ